MKDKSFAVFLGAILMLMISVLGCGQILGGRDTIAPSIPAGLTAIAGNTTNDITWEGNSESDLAGFNVYRSTASGDEYTKIATVKLGTVFWDMGEAATLESLSLWTRTAAKSGPLNYPNPFDSSSESTYISYTLLDNADITVEVYDIHGNIVWQASYEAGTEGGRVGYNEVMWDGLDESSQAVGDGIYPYKCIINYGSGVSIEGDYILVLQSGGQLTNSTPYYYVVTAFDTSDNESGYSAEVLATPEAINSYSIWVTTREVSLKIIRL